MQCTRRTQLSRSYHRVGFPCGNKKRQHPSDPKMRDCLALSAERPDLWALPNYGNDGCDGFSPYFPLADCG